MIRKLLDEEPGRAEAEDGIVFVDGPSSIALTLSADVAARTGQAMIDAAKTAQQQKKEQPGSSG